MLIVYTDYRTATVSGETIYMPGFKLGNGNSYLSDLPFLDEDIRLALEEHLENSEIHITSEERDFWNNKLNYVEPEDDLLEFTRD